ncbi:thiamine pyrophosphate-dependent dehydrogenase E1 component subunit alpha [Bordetella sp. 15P40C-2]|uniref:thiamine pyrophosphate-dependent dehydrogenase E1 component subunit alpha n=1 Tax=Bordetella sp. 15P40C-2 TaxID=2572246 RepID=UPI001322EA4D|nr:thiamine pyrophosphate-dependent dehydrogenase E1 component subunit alpha [Bordetella sp. 15P40C-2]MVW70969.1 ABC transporter substrate-binding protein [Bordetella sp. 15P40C-2]
MAVTAHVDRLRSLYRVIRTIRTVENSLTKLFADGEVPGFIHLSVGQEAIAAGVCAALSDQDTLATTHRGHGHVLARGLSLDHFFKEVMGKAGGVCGGRGGSMHVADMDIGILGANGIVGAGIPIALGSALAHQVRATGGVAVAFFGDGAMAEGVLHETLNMAALWKLPLLLVCENNGWSEFSPTSRQFAAALEDIAAAFKVRYAKVDGNDVLAVADAAQSTVAQLRQGDGPAVLECVTQRVRGHYEGDPQKYRAADELAALTDDDPVTRTEALLRQHGLKDEDIAQITQQVEAEVDQAIDAARADVEPDYAAALRDVYTVVA